MEFGLFFSVPWMLCIVLFVILGNQIKQRKSEKEWAQRRFDDAQREAAAMMAQLEMRLRSECVQKEAQAQSELLEIRRKAEQRIREERESILSNKERLRALSDKDVLIECMSALNTYAQRLDRLENRMADMAISVDDALNKKVKEKKPYAHSGVITDDDLIKIVNDAAKRVDRIINVTVNDAVVRGIVLSQHKVSKWSFSIDFNDDGELTGNYTVYSENDDSTIPERLAFEISKEIVYRLNT